jgi:hypothetical protein
MSFYKYFPRKPMFEDFFYLNQITNLKIIEKHTAFLIVNVGKKILSNKIKFLILSKNLHSLVEKYFFRNSLISS